MSDSIDYIEQIKDLDPDEVVDIYADLLSSGRGEMSAWDCDGAIKMLYEFIDAIQESKDDQFQREFLTLVDNMVMYDGGEIPDLTNAAERLGFLVKRELTLEKVLVPS